MYGVPGQGRFRVPEDITALSDDELSQTLAIAVEAFDATSQASTITPRGLESVRTLASGIASIRDE